MLMITLGVFMDTIFKLLIVFLPFQQIDLKCQMAIITRVVFHYIAYLFILFRINRILTVNDIKKRLIDGNELDRYAKSKFQDKMKTADGE